MSNKNIFILVIVILVLGTGAAVLLNSTPTGPVAPGKYDAFAQCLKNQGATFYGAFWCPHCQAQEKALQTTRQDLEKIGLYVECSTLDGQSQTKECTDKGITGYPTWILKDGTRIPDDDPNGGGVKLETLAAKTSCPLPQ
jgi:hypothetical protein